MFARESVDPENFFLIFFGVLLADSIAIKQFIIDIIRIVSLLALLLLFHSLLHHLHYDFLKVIDCHKVSSDHVAIVVVIILLE